MKLDKKTLKQLGYGNMWKVQITLIYDLRQHTLEVKRVNMAKSREHTLKRSPTAPCKGCGIVFENRQNGWLRDFHSDKCRQDYHHRIEKQRRMEEAKLRQTNCLECEKELIQNTAKPKKFCSDKCGRKYRDRQK